VYRDGVTPQENPQVSGPTDNEGNFVGKEDGGFMFTFANFTEEDVGWYFIEVRFDCNFPAADPALADEYNPVLLQKDKVWDPVTNLPYRGEKFYIDENFALTPGATGMRIPLLPEDFRPLVVRKSADSKFAEIGDYVKWTVTVTNPNADYTVFSVKVVDVLPLPFRYKSGTTRIDGAPAPDPSIGSNGRTLVWEVGDLPPNTTKTITFYAIVGADAKRGRYKNAAYATGWSDDQQSIPIGSNTAYAYVNLSRGVFTEKAYVIGSVFVDLNGNGIRDEDEPGLANVRIYLEDGRYALTDEEGKFHFDNVNPGVHVVRIDENSLPPGATPLLNSTLQGLLSPNSVLIDLYAGDIYRVDVPVKLSSAKAEKVVGVDRTVLDVRKEASTEEYFLLNSLSVKNLTDKTLYNLEIKECGTSELVGGTVTLNGASFDDPARRGNCYVWTVPVVLPGENFNLQWYATVSEYRNGTKPSVSVSAEDEYGVQTVQKVAIPVWLYEGKHKYILLFSENIADNKELIDWLLAKFAVIIRQAGDKKVQVVGVSEKDKPLVEELLRKHFIDKERIVW